MRETNSTCPYCSVGCGVLIALDGARITRMRGDPGHPANVFAQLLTGLSTPQMKLGDGACVPELKRLIALRGTKPHEHVASAP